MAVNSLTRDTLTNTVKYTSMLAGNEFFNPDASSDFLITETVLSSSTTSVTFDVSTLAAAGYKHLQIRYAARSDRSSSDGTDAMVTRFNGDSGANYNTHLLNGTTAVSSAYETYQNGMDYTYIDAAGSTTGAFAAGIMDFLDPFSSTKFKARRVFWGKAASASTYVPVGLSSALWRSTSAVTSITFSVRYGTNFVAGSRFSLYGSKG